MRTKQEESEIVVLSPLLFFSILLAAQPEAELKKPESAELLSFAPKIENKKLQCCRSVERKHAAAGAVGVNFHLGEQKSNRSRPADTFALRRLRKQAGTRGL